MYKNKVLGKEKFVIQIMERTSKMTVEHLFLSIAINERDNEIGFIM